MKVLVLNAGSSSMKIQLIETSTEEPLAKASCERIGADSLIKYRTAGKNLNFEKYLPTHIEALQEIILLLTQGEGAIIKDISEIEAVGHRVSNGGNFYAQATLLTRQVMDDIESLFSLAPLHNPANLMGIKACQRLIGMEIPQVAVFDTSFHRTIPEQAYMYAIPYRYYEKYHIRKYGFHGISHQYVSERLAELMGGSISELKVITCHLGSGSSIAAIRGGRSVDTTMGFTPLSGLLMGTRCGSIDPSIVTFLQKKENLTPEQIDGILYKESGLLGISDVSGDCRDLEKAAGEDNHRAELGLRMLYYQVKRNIGGYAAAMGGLDAVVFTGGIGENSVSGRAAICEGLSFLGIALDEQANGRCRFGVEGRIDKSGGVEVYVIPTNEELMIARDTCRLVMRHD